MNRKQLIQNNEVSTLYTFSLGGYPQKVLIEGKFRALPVVITLHGGPGNPIPFSVGCRGLFPEFTDHFLMVYWDQLGCGINNTLLDDSFSIRSFVEIPYYILQGETDLVASTKEVLKLVNQAENPNLHCEVIPDTGHIPGAELMEVVVKRLMELL